MSVWQGDRDFDVQPWAPPAGARLAASLFIQRRFPTLGKALRAERLIPLELSFTALDGVVGWGSKLQASISLSYARLRELRYWSLEDGFLRSVGLGKSNHHPISIVVDDLGIHHDPIIESRLERLILQGSSQTQIEFARGVRQRLIEERLTKYNCDKENARKLPKPRKGKRILLIDQVAGDAATAPYGRTAFERMWFDAIDQGAELLVRDHPDVLAGFSKGILRNLTCNYNSRDILDGCGHIDDLLAEVDEVWTVSSQFGFEALIRGKRVVTYGMPFYAGWHLTEDRGTDPASLAARRRRLSRQVTIDELVASSLVRYPIYFDPIEERRIGINRAMDRLSAWRREADRVKGRRHLCVGFSRHKRRTARLFLGAAGSDVSFSDTTSDARNMEHHVFWGRSDRSDSPAQFLTVEDGFIRSAGLGSDMVRARSLCIDPIGIYYDSTRPSLLECILNDTTFDEALLHRAQRLRRSIVESNISKYNLAADRFDVRSLGTDRPIAIVAEQIPDDASLRFGKSVHGSSLALLAAVRASRPDHFIIFKRHPDILSGNRPNHGANRDYAQHADYVLDHKVDLDWREIAECHSATSQLGFEALLRGVKTYCYGAPFYSGWGLTVDSVEVERRNRKLSIDELVAGCLILYPSYRCWRTRLPCGPEDVIRDIIRERITSPPHTSMISRVC